MDSEFIYIRTAKLSDTEIMASLEKQFIDKFPIFSKTPKSASMFAREISSITHKNSIHLIAEKDNIITGFIEVKYIPQIWRGYLGIPMVDTSYEDMKEQQVKLIEKAIHELQGRGIKEVYAEIPTNHLNAIEVFERCSFKRKKTVVEIWDGFANPEFYQLGLDYNIRKPREEDEEEVWNLIKDTMDVDSPFFLSRGAFTQIFKNAINDGWAVVEKDDKIVSVVSSFVDRSKTAVIFGPFANKRHVGTRIPLMNEILWYYKLKGIDFVRVMRSQKFLNDTEVFETFSLSQYQVVELYTRKL